MSIRKQVRLGRLAVLGITLMVVALVLAWGHAAHQPAQADETGARMALNVSGEGTSCDDASEPTECIVPLGAAFTLAVDVIEAPADGYVGVQSYLDYGIYDPTASEDDQGPGTCGDGVDNFDQDGKDRSDPNDCVDLNLTYRRGSAANEIVWPDLGSDEVALRGELGQGLVNHGGLTGLLPPLPVSTFEGTVVALGFTCSADESTTQIDLLPYNDGEVVPPGTDGAGFAVNTTTRVPAKALSLTVRCEGVAAQPTNTPGAGPGETPGAPSEGTATPEAEGFPPTGDAGGIDAGGGVGSGLWAVIGALLAAAAAGLAVFGWRYARGRQAR